MKIDTEILKIEYLINGMGDNPDNTRNYGT